MCKNHILLDIYFNVQTLITVFCNAIFLRNIAYVTQNFHVTSMKLDDSDS